VIRQAIAVLVIVVGVATAQAQTPVRATRVKVGADAIARADAMPGTALQAQAAYRLPIAFRGLAIRPGQAQPRLVDFEAVVLVMRGLRYTSGRFEAELAVGLRNRAAPADLSTLVEPVTIVVTAAADEVTPGTLRIAKFGEPQSVRVAVANPATPFYATARTLLDDGDRIEVPVDRPVLGVVPAAASIVGLGLAKTVLQVRTTGLDRAEGVSIALRTDRGAIVPTPVVLGADGTAHADLWSDGVGPAFIEASGPPFEAATAMVVFEWPWRFLAATLLGALAGWFVGPKTRGKTKTSPWRSVLVAIVSAAILSAAYAIGINWLRWTPAAVIGDALAFFVAAAGAYLGVKVLFEPE